MNSFLSIERMERRFATAVRARAFTLIELVVSMVVLVLIVVSVSGMVNSVSQTTTAERRHLEADNEARRVFDRMAADFGRMVKRADADTVFASVAAADGTHGANDKIFFYSDAPAYYAASSSPSPSPVPVQSMAGLIGYRIQNEAASASARCDLQLERLGKGLTWDLPTATSTPGAVVFLTFPANAPSPTPTPTPFAASTFAGVYTLTPGSTPGPAVWGGTGVWSSAIGSVPPTVPAGAANGYDDGVDSDYHVLSNYVFRLEYCFVLKNATPTSQFVTSIAQGQGFSNVSAIVVAVALLDPRGRAQMPPNVTMSTLAAALPDPNFAGNTITNVAGTSLNNPLPGKLMAELWDATIKDPNFASSLGIPPGVASQIRVYQRYFYLNTP